MRSPLLLALFLVLLIFACAAGLAAGAFVGANLSAAAVPPALATLLTARDLEPPTVTASPPPPIPTLPAPSAPAPAAPVVVDPERRLVQLYEHASPAVVNITTQVLRRNFFWGAIPESGSGSGFVWDEQGHILTNYHVIEGAQSVEVSFGDDILLPAQVIGADPPNDLAIIKVEKLPEGVTPLPLGDSDRLAVGQTAVAIGNPFGQFQRTLTAGVISALDRTIELDQQRVLRGVIQTDAAINRGNSGGPLLDSEGRVIGITSAIFSPSGTSAGVGLAIPINKAIRLAPVLIREGRYLHPWLGIEGLGYALNPPLAQALRLPVNEGLLVAQIYRDSPAQRAGIRPATREEVVGNRRYLTGGDILTAIDGLPLKSWEDLNAYLAERTEVGQTVTLTLVRDGEALQIAVEVGAEP